MTEKDKLNVAHHEKILGKCVHGKNEYVEKDILSNRIYKCSLCGEISTLNIPDYTSSDKIFRECVVEYQISLSWHTIHGKRQCVAKLFRGTTEYGASDPNPNHAVIKAVLKREGGEV